MAKKETVEVEQETTAIAVATPWFLQAQAATEIPDSPVEPPKPFVQVAPMVLYNRKEGAKNTKWFSTESRQNSKGVDKTFFVDSPDLPAKTDKLMIAPIMILPRSIVWSTDEAKPGPTFEHPNSQGPFPDVEGKIDSSYRMLYYDVQRGGFYMMEFKNGRAQREAEYLNWQMIVDAKAGKSPYDSTYFLYTYANTAKSDQGSFTNYYPRFKRTGDDLLSGTRVFDAAEGPEYDRAVTAPDVKKILDVYFGSNPPTAEALASKLFTLTGKHANNVVQEMEEGKLSPEDVLAIKPTIFRLEEK